MQKLFKALNCLVKIDDLIKSESTGTPTQLSDKVGVSKRTIHKYIKAMKEQGAPIMYKRMHKHQSYFYSEKGTFFIGFRKNVNFT